MLFRSPRTSTAHRALADAEMAAHLLEQIRHDLRSRHKVSTPDHALLMALQRCAKAAVGAMVARYAAASYNALLHPLSQHG